MSTLEQSARACRKPNILYSLLIISSVYLIDIFVVAMGFYVPAGEGYVRMPGVIITVMVTAIAVCAFLVCPRRPIWTKAFALLLLVPLLLFAVNCVMGVFYYAMPL